MNLGPGEISNNVNINDADGVLLDGRDVLFDSIRTDLGGGQVQRAGAIKVCDLGTLTVRNSPTNSSALVAEISTAGFVCPGDPAGYKTPQWCSSHPGWDVNAAPVGRTCV